jgi:hypothetical protein
MVYLYAGLFGRDRPAMVQIPDPDPQLERLREAAHHRVRMFPLLVLISLAAAFVAGSIAPVLG